MTPPLDPLEGFRTLLDRSPDLLFRVRLRPEPRFEFVSRAAEVITGLPADAFMEDFGQVARLHADASEDADDADDGGPRATASVRQVLGMDPRELPERLRVSIRRIDGSRAWVEVDLAVQLDGAGEAVSIDGAVRDVTDLVAARGRVAFEARILAAIADAVVVTDAEARITFWNPGAARIFGVPAGQAVGRPMSVMFPDDRASGHEPLQDAISRAEAWEGDVRMAEADGTARVLEVVSYPLHEDQPSPSRVSLVWDVTRQREATEAEARLAAVVNQADDAIYTVDGSGVVITWNAGAERLTGTPATSAIGRPGPLVAAPERRAEICRQVFEEGASFSFPDTELRKVGGDTVPVSVSVSPVRGANGEVRAILIVARDERPRVEADRQLRFRDAILAAVDDAVIATDEDRLLVYWSPGAERLFGVSAADAVGRPTGDVAPFRLVGSTDERALATLSVGRAVRVDAEHTRPDGTTFVGETHARLMAGPGGSTVGLAVIRDVTAIRRAADDSARLAAIVEGAGDIIVGTSLEGVLRSWNPAAERALGYSAREIIGRTIATYIAPEDLPKAFSLRERVILGGESSAAAEFTYVARDGVTFPTWVVIAPVRNAEGEVVGVSAVAHDLRTRKSLEEQLRQAQKLEAVGRLAGGIAHDFNNLLTAITGYASLLLAEVPEGGSAAADVGQILDATDRAGELTRSLLAFSRGKPREPRLVALDDLVAGVGPLLHRLLPEAAEVVLDARSGATVLVDPTELELVLVNLAVNGADAMPHGGRLEIRARSVELDRAFADEHLGVRPGRHAELVVRDSGAGMTEAVRSHLFEPFFTTKGDQGGTGLGLSTVHAFVEQAGGTIWVDTEPGRGTTFRILVPESEGVPERSSASRAHRAPGGSERVVLVEDDAPVRALATTVLGRAGYSLTVKADAREAARLDPATFDLLVTDVVMPYLDGPGLAARLRDARPDLPVLFMSGYADRADTAQVTSLSSQPILAKPFGPLELLTAVRRVLYGSG